MGSSILAGQNWMNDNSTCLRMRLMSPSTLWKSFMGVFTLHCKVNQIETLVNMAEVLSGLLHAHSIDTRLVRGQRRKNTIAAGLSVT